ncbi:MBL fold metallo-hydrolase [Streptomyces varsoviensis]|uniref:MBL fold metallo-hydrolase n=1 Tax=Streptomyces varsoviensis TaxID=67373 RepID=UPI0034063FC5
MADIQGSPAPGTNDTTHDSSAGPTGPGQPLRTETIAPGVFAFIQGDGSWGWSNAGLVASRGEALLVDTFYTLPLTRRLRTAVAAAAPDARVTTVVNTHLNGDHCHGNQLFPDAEIITSDANAAGIDHEVPPALYPQLQQNPPAGPAGEYFTHHFGHFDFSGIEFTPPTRTFRDRLDLRVGDLDVELLNVGPAHTGGDVVVHVPEASTVFLGDILFQDDHPVVWAGPVLAWADACDRLIATGARTFVPGHGRLAGPADLARFRDYLRHVHEEAARAAAAGVPLATAARAIPLDAYAGWPLSERVVATVAAVYREVGAPAPAAPLELLTMMAEIAAERGAKPSDSGRLPHQGRATHDDAREPGAARGDTAE